MAKRRLSAAQQARLIEEWSQSGLSVPAFCQQRGLSYGTMKGWLYKPGLKRAIANAQRGGRFPRGKPDKSSMPSAPSPGLVPVRLAQAAGLPTGEPTGPPAIAIVLAGGRRVVVERGFDPVTLRQVVTALESGSC